MRTNHQRCFCRRFEGLPEQRRWCFKVLHKVNKKTKWSYPLMLNFTREGVYIWFAATKTTLENHYNFSILDVVGWKSDSWKLHICMYGESCTGTSGKKSKSLFCLYSLWSATNEVLFLPLPWCLQQQFPGYAEGVLHRELCRVPVVLQMASNLSDLVLSDKLPCQKTCLWQQPLTC